MTDDARHPAGGGAPTPGPDADRRALLKAGTLLLGASLLPPGMADLGGAAGEASTGSPPDSPLGEGAPAVTVRMVTPQDEAVLALVADAIFPTTPDSPGAIAAGVPPVVTRLLNDCWDDRSRAELLAGLDAFRARAQGRHGRPFPALTPAQRLALLAAEDAAATPAVPQHWFHQAYRVIAQAYWSSEAGATKALRWVAVPGRWVGCTTLEAGQPAWY